MPAVYLYSFVHLLYGYVVLDKTDLLSEEEIFPCYSGQGVSCCVISTVCVLVTVTRTIHVPNKEHFKPPKSMAAIPLVLQTTRAPVEPTRATPLHSLKYAFTPTSNVTANPQGGIDCSGPYGSKGYIFMWQ